MKTELVKRLKKCAEDFKSLFPEGHYDGIDLQILCSGRPCINIHRFPDYKSACDYFRSLGIKKWTKQVIDAENPRCVITGRCDDIEICAFITGLPPTCRIVEHQFQVPKTQVVDTGEFVIIKEKKVVCGK